MILFWIVETIGCQFEIWTSHETRVDVGARFTSWEAAINWAMVYYPDAIKSVRIPLAWQRRKTDLR
jgi:hypothetical protein